MDSEKLSNWLQIVGLFGVIGSLMFVGMQLKQSQDIAASSASQTRTWGTVEAMMIRTSSPALLSGLKKVWVSQIDLLEPEEIIALYWDHGAMLKMAEDNYLQYQNGFLSEDRWATSLVDIRCQYSNVFYRGIGVLPGHTESFLEILNTLFAEAGTNPSDCYSYEPGSIYDWGESLRNKALDQQPSVKE